LSPQHFLCFPEPHGQGSLRPTFLGDAADRYRALVASSQVAIH
jgi:hypothetical protein